MADYQYIAFAGTLISRDFNDSLAGVLVEARVYHVELLRIVGDCAGNPSGIHIIRQQLAHKAVLEHFCVG